MTHAIDLNVLANGLATTGSPLLFAAAGTPVARALVVDTRIDGLQNLLDAMERRLGDVRRAMVGQTHSRTRVDVASAAAVLAIARPHLTRFCIAAIRGMLAPLSPAAWSSSSEHLALRPLLHQIVGAEDDASRALDALCARRPDSLTAELSRHISAQLGKPDSGAVWGALQRLGRRAGDALDPRVLAAAALAIRAHAPAPQPLPVPTEVAVPA